MRPIPIILILLALVSIADARPRRSAPALPTFTGKVVAVLDGDTLDLLDGKTIRRIRFEGVDAPERGQPSYQVAKDYAAKVLMGETITVQVTALAHNRDGSTRYVARVPIGGKDFCVDLVERGYCWWYRGYAPGAKDLEEAEARAHKAKRGLWAEAKPIAPWEWRKLSAEARERERQKAGK